MTSNGKQFTITREMLTAVAGISARYSKFAFVLFCYITNHLMSGPLGTSEFCFPRISMFPSTSSRETLRFSGNKIHCSPRDQSLSVYYSFKIFPRFGLVETTRIIHHNQLLFTKFGKNLRHIQSLTPKVEPAAYYSTVDVKMTSKVEPAADYSTIDRKKPGDEIVILVSRKTKSETAKLH